MLETLYIDDYIEIQLITDSKSKTELHIFTDEFRNNNDTVNIDNLYRDSFARLVKYLDVDCELMRSDEITIENGKLEIKFGIDYITLYHKR